MSIVRRFLASLPLVGLALSSALLGADPLTKHLDIDFGRDVASRNLQGLATRSDGRIVPGPTLTDLAGPAVGELLWTLEPTSGAAQGWLIGTGPEGRIVEVTLNGTSYTTREVARVAEPQVVALKSLPDGALLAGTSPTGAVYLIRDGKTLARVGLPVDSIFDVLLLPEVPPGAAAHAPTGPTFLVALVATGNPGRIYRVALDQFRAAGVNAGRLSDPAALAARGVTLFGEMRDRNVRRLALLPDGRIAAGSAPHGNVYLFPRNGGHPVLLQENHEAEVTDLLPQPNGDLYATVVYSSSPGEYRIHRPGGAGATPAFSAGAAAAANPGDNAPPLPAASEGPSADRFGGRSSVVFFPADGFPEVLLTRSSLAFYRLVRRGDLLLIAAGDQGELLAWDLKRRLSLTFAGSVGSQLNGLAATPGSADRFLLLRNNAPGLALLEFGGTGPRRLETNRLDLGLPAELGNLRFAQVRNLAPAALQVDVKTSLAADESEGWTDWTRLAPRDGAQYAANLRGRYLKFRIAIPADAPDVEVDTATLYFLPQNRRPVLTDFRVLPPNFLLNPPPEMSVPLVTTLGQLLNPNQPAALPEGIQDNRKKLGFLGSQLVPDPGNQAVYWTVSDPDGDTLAYTFSIKSVGGASWIDLAVDIRENYVQFDTSHLPEGIYTSRLIVTEQAPRPAAQRLRTEFETDDLVIDHTPPEILDAAARRDGNSVIVTVHGRDALSLLDGAELIFNNGYRETVDHPVDGINDGREETYELECPAAKVTGATAVEIRLSDEVGNTAARRVALP
jgi:hypothetical protein